jgi:membrane-bound ClpP family serine protease
MNLNPVVVVILVMIGVVALLGYIIYKESGDDYWQ